MRCACILLLYAVLAAPAGAAESLLVSLPASVDDARARAMGGPIVDLLTLRTGARFELARHTSPLSYIRDLAANRFAVVFEGPHVLAALGERGAMHAVGEFRQTLSYVVAVPRDDERVFQIGDLGGKPVCTGEMPDLFGLHLAATIGNPSREPVMVPIADPIRRIRSLLGGGCVAATLQTARLLTLTEREGVDDLRVVFKSRDLPGFGAAVSDSLAPTLRQKLTDVLLSGEGSLALRALAVGVFGNEVPLAAAEPKRLEPLAGLMDAFMPW